MKITIATGIFPPEIGGPATYLKDMVPLWKKNKWEIDVVTYGEPRAGITTIPRDSMFRFFKFLHATYRSAKNSDIVFATDTISSGLPAALASKLTHKPLVVRFVGDQAWETSRTNNWTTDDFEHFQKKKQKWYVEMLRKIQRWTLRRAHILTVSQFLKRVATNWGMHDITVIPNAIPPLTLPPRDQLRKKFSYDKNFICLYAGRLTSYKGVDKIIHAIAKLQKEIPHIRFVVIGDGPAMDTAVNAAREERITHLVTFLGRQDEKTTRAHMKAADLVLLNSEYEGMSHMLLEAISVKTPIAASNIGANTELIGKNGCLFPYDDMDELAACIKNVASDPESAKKRADKAFSAVTTREKQEKDTITFLQSILNNSSRR